MVEIAIEQIDASGFERLLDPVQGFCGPGQVAAGRLDPLDGRKAHPGAVRKLLLAYPEQAAGGANLERDQHDSRISTALSACVASYITILNSS